MTTKNNRKVIVQKRDGEVLRFLFKYKAAAAGQIKAGCFPRAGEGAVRARMGKLKRLGLVGDGIIPRGEFPVKYYHLKEAAMPLVRHFYPKARGNYQLRSECLAHDLTLLEIGQRFSKKDCVARYVTENVLQSNESFTRDKVLGDFVERRSDAFLDLREPRGARFHVAVEYENSKKATGRYARWVNDYHLSDAVDFVFLFYRQNSVKKAVVKWEKGTWPKKRPKFYFCKVDEGRDWTGKVSLSNRLGETVNFK